MKILFIVPSQDSVYGIKMSPVYPPLGVLYLASMLENENHVAGFIDMDIEGLGAEELLERVAAEAPDVAGITCVTPTIDNGIDIAAKIKSRFPNIVIVMGGIHPTIDPENTINHECVDVVCIGESEHTVCELISELERGGRDLSRVTGIYYKKNGTVHKTHPRELEKDLDAFPFPAFHLIKDLSKYSPPDAQEKPVVPIMTSRGCPGKCTYCQTKQIFGTKFRARSVDNIVGEIDMLVNKFGIRELHFMDDNLSTNRKRILDLCDELKKRNYPIRYEISNGIRADMVNEEILTALRSIGLVNIGFGVESGNEEILRIAKKGISKDQVRKSMKIAKKIGFETWAFFIIGLYKETGRTIQDTIDFAIELDPDFAKFLILKPYPGSEIFQQLKDEGLIDSCDYRKYGVYTEPVHHLHDLSSAEILNWQKKAFRKFYFRPGKILGHIIRINSWTRLKIAFKGFIFILSRIVRFK
jgi:anaerobic magnesium-protoporphyrin IX monomethyl ester cyclase